MFDIFLSGMRKRVYIVRKNSPPLKKSYIDLEKIDLSDLIKKELEKEPIYNPEFEALFKKKNK